jgi:septum formation protein
MIDRPPPPAARDTPDRPLVLASGSPRRRELLCNAGYRFQVDLPSEGAECGICSRESPPELVARLAYQKARDVAPRWAAGLILSADTVASCGGRILGKPQDRRHAKEMLELLRGRRHEVYTGVCLWHRPSERRLVDVSCSVLQMAQLPDSRLEAYLDSGLWEGKAGAFGYQDELDWVRVIEGSESNVVGLPLERLETLFAKFAQLSQS